MSRRTKQAVQQDRQSIATLSIFALCLKMLLPIVTSFFVSYQATASVADNSNNAQTSLEQSLSFICTPGGILLNQNGVSSSTNLTDHCDFCITGAFVSLQRDTGNLAAYTLNQSSLSWPIIRSKQTKLLFNGHRHSSRAPPRV
ncbi:hypothetical protein WH96_01740 [Kiloniella spongiae]|uniref:DUF2946 domain-containing protein n=1 Tax=Kiloniella spongiae TaxID=1489064 RepID=A0A0H2MI49_9PROT|nr:hypothetical protein [Kiloniella spongiae]KLN62269.1 hypothetical protein WH96_01740 [Kiloniella spongiae]